jgi:hypothetical protein
MKTQWKTKIDNSSILKDYLIQRGSAEYYEFTGTVIREVEGEIDPKNFESISAMRGFIVTRQRYINEVCDAAGKTLLHNTPPPSQAEPSSFSDFWKKTQ